MGLDVEFGQRVGTELSEQSCGCVGELILETGCNVRNHPIEGVE